MTNESALETKHAQVIGWLLDGKRDSEVALSIGVSRQAVGQFRRKHAAELQPRVEKIRLAHLRDKEARINKLNWVAESIEAELVKRGFMWLEPFGAEREVLKMPTGAIREYRETIKAIAEELGELPRPDVHIDNRKVIIRQYVGWPEQLT